MDSSEACDALSCHFPFSCVESLPIFEVGSHSSVTYFPVHVVCLHFPRLQVGNAWREGEGLSPRQPCLPLAPHFTRGSWVGRQGLGGPGCTEWLPERCWCTHWPYCNIYSFKASTEQQSLQQAGSCSGLGAGEFAFCICCCSCWWFSCVSGYLCFLFSSVFGPRWGQQEVAQWEENQFGPGHGIHVKSFSCLLAGVHGQSKLPGQESCENVLCLRCTDFFLLSAFTSFLKKKNMWSIFILPISHGFAVVLHWFPCILWGSIASSPAKCSGSLPDRSAHFLPSFPSPSISASWASTDQRRVLFYF